MTVICMDVICAVCFMDTMAVVVSSDKVNGFFKLFLGIINVLKDKALLV